MGSVELFRAAAFESAGVGSLVVGLVSVGSPVPLVYACVRVIDDYPAVAVAFRDETSLVFAYTAIAAGRFKFSVSLLPPVLP